jgi:hypothetical protein
MPREYAPFQVYYPIKGGFTFTYCNTGDFFSFFLQKLLVKKTHFERGIDAFNYFSLISVILFCNQDHPFD